MRRQQLRSIARSRRFPSTQRPRVGQLLGRSRGFSPVTYPPNVPSKQQVPGSSPGRGANVLPPARPDRVAGSSPGCQGNASDVRRLRWRLTGSARPGAAGCSSERRGAGSRLLRAGRGAHRALEANPLPAGKRNAPRWKAHLLFVDEAGFLPIPTLRRTWAPRGQAPKVSYHYRHDRFSVLSGLSVSPVRRRVGLCFRCHRNNIRQAEVCAFFRPAWRRLRGDVIAILDNASIHKGEPLRGLRRRHPRLHLEFLPPYTPELNPDEGVWADSKARLANGRPDDLDVLYQRLHATLRSLERSPRRRRRSVHQSELSLCLKHCVLYADINSAPARRRDRATGRAGGLRRGRAASARGRSASFPFGPRPHSSCAGAPSATTRAQRSSR